MTSRAGGVLVTEDATAARIELLVETLYDRLLRLAIRLTSDRERSRDLVQETFLRAARRAESLPEEPTAAEAWLVRVLVNLFRDELRRRRVRGPAVDLERIEPLATADRSAALAARWEVADGLARLPPRQRAMLVLVELEGRSAAEAAALLGIAGATGRWHLAAARRRFAAAVRQRRQLDERRPS